MERFFRAGLLAVLCFPLVCGCGKSGPAAGGDRLTTGPVPTDPAGRVAHEFFAAVLRGDTQAASTRLTPAAMQRIVERKEQFAPPGEESVIGFQVGRIARPAEGVALVQCLAQEKTSPEQTQQREICIVARQVDDQWRVSGIAHATAPGGPLMLFDFETGQHRPISQQPTAEMNPVPAAGANSAAGQDSPGGTPAAPTPTATRPSPPRAGGEPALPSYR
jgi:hypothetical protein